MTDREQVLKKIRASLGDVPSAETLDGLRSWGPGRATDHGSVDLFVERVEEYRGAVRRTSPDGISEVIRELCGVHSVGNLLTAPGVDGGWVPDGVSSVVDTGFSAVELDGFDGVLTGCRLAIAETGTVVLDGGPLSGRRAITLVPDLHICIVPDGSDRRFGTRSDGSLESGCTRSGPTHVRLGAIGDLGHRVPEGRGRSRSAQPRGGTCRWT